MVNEASTMEPGCNGNDGGSMVLSGDGVTKETVVVVVTPGDHHGGDQGVQLRSSARVSKKLKLDSQAAAATAASLKKVSELDDKVPPVQTSPVAAGGSSASGTVSGGSGCSAASAAAAAATAASETQRPKGRRANETSLWSMDDKNAFFESLNEFGKDFDAIHHHIEVKARKRGEQEPKSRDQVRHFYYRTWNKISKHLRFPDGTAKATQELYGLVNYGEMRKKIGYPYTAKNSHKLKELIFLGSTQIRIKGKTWRIKTPICKALRKLNALEADCCEEVKLPPRVTVELRPRDNGAWARVQALAYNPRVSAELALHRRLGSLIAHLEARWRCVDDKLRQTLTVNEATGTANGVGSINPTSASSSSQPESATAGTSNNEVPPLGVPNDPPAYLNSSPPTTSSSSSSSSLALANLLTQTDDALELCVAPQQGAQMVEASFKMSTIATSAKLSFLSYTDRQGKDYSHILTEAASKNSRMRAGALKRQRSDSSCEKGSGGSSGGSLLRGAAADGSDRELQAADAADHLDDHLPPLSSCELIANSDQQQQAVLSDDGSAAMALADSSTSPMKDELQQLVDGDVADVAEVAFGGGHESPAETSERMATNLHKMRSGWTADNAGTMCIGEMYVMLGSDSRLILEYWWRKKGGENQDSDTKSPDQPLPTPQPSTPVTTALQKLVSLAKLSYRKTRVSCPCGHVCNLPSDPANPAVQANPAGARGVARMRGAASKLGVDVGGAQVPQPVTASGQANLPMDGVFRKPTLAPLKPKADTGDQFKFKAQLDKLKLLRFCNRRGRNSRSKNVIVPRILPLLPKVPADKQLMFKFRPTAPDLGGLGAGGGVVVTSGGGAMPTFRSISSTKEAVHQPVLSTASQLVSFAPTVSFSMPITNNHMLVPIQLNQTLNETPVTLESSAESAAAADADPSTNTKEDDSNKETEPLNVPKPVDVIEDEPPPSPMGLLKEEMLINTDDYSLSSLLGHLESPDKSCSAAFGDDPRHIADVSCDDSRLPDVDAQLQSLMCEDSVDYMGKFADLAAKLTSDSLSHDNV